MLEFSSLELTLETAQQLTLSDAESWSAMTIQDEGTFPIVITPPGAYSTTVDLTHELALIQLKHVPARVEVSQTGALLLCDYSDEQEQGADWHAGTLLVPRDGLVQMRAPATSPCRRSQWG